MDWKNNLDQKMPDIIGVFGCYLSDEIFVSAKQRISMRIFSIDALQESRKSVADIPLVENHVDAIRKILKIKKSLSGRKKKSGC